MSDKETNICYSEEDLGKNLYRKKTYYTLVIEQDVLANDEDEADRLFQDSGINHEKINTELTEENNGVETYYVEWNLLCLNTNYVEIPIMFNELHKLVTEEFLARIKAGEATTADLKAAADWLYKNDITGVAFDTSPLGKLADIMPVVDFDTVQKTIHR